MQEGELAQPKEEFSSFFEDIQLLGLGGRHDLDLDTFSDKEKLLSFEGAQHIELLEGNKGLVGLGGSTNEDEEESVPLDLEDLLLLSNPESSLKFRRQNRHSEGMLDKHHSPFLLSDKKLGAEPVTTGTRVTEDDDKESKRMEDQNLLEEPEHSNIPKETQPHSVTSQKSMGTDSETKHKIASTRLSVGDEEEDDFYLEKFQKDQDFNSFQRIIAGEQEESEIAPSSSIFDTLIEKAPEDDEGVSIRISSQEALNMNSLSELVESMEHLINEVPPVKDAVLTLDDQQFQSNHSIEEEESPLPLHSEEKRAGAFNQPVMTNSRLIVESYSKRRVHFEWLDYFSGPCTAHSTSNGVERSWNKVKPKESTGSFKAQDVRLDLGEDEERVKGPRHYRGNSFGLNGGLEFNRPTRVHTVAEEQEQQEQQVQESAADSMSQIEPAQATTNSTLFNESRISEDKTQQHMESKFDTITEIMKHTTPEDDLHVAREHIKELETLVSILQSDNSRLNGEVQRMSKQTESAQLTEQLVIACFRAFYTATQATPPFEALLEEIESSSVEPHLVLPLEERMEKCAREVLERVRKQEEQKWEERSRSKVRVGSGLNSARLNNKENSAENRGKQEAKKSVRMKNTSQYLLPKGQLRRNDTSASSLIQMKLKSEPLQSPAKNTLSEYLNSSAQKRKNSPRTRNVTMQQPRSAYQNYMNSISSTGNLSRFQKKYVTDLSQGSRRSPDVFKDSLDSSVKRVASFAAKTVNYVGKEGKMYGLHQLEKQRAKSKNRDKSFQKELKSALKQRLKPSSISRQLRFEDE